MNNRLKMACYNLFGAFLFLLAACAPAVAPKPADSTAGSSSTGSSGAGARAGEGARGSGTESGTGASSLQQMQEGKSAVTSASSPLKDVYFDFDRYDLSADARSVLRANSDWLKSNPGARVEIEGHCDDRGTNEYNLALGAKRAQSAREYLVTLGIAANRLSTISYGEEIPVCKEQTESCWKQNRRARFVILQGRPTS